MCGRLTFILWKDWQVRAKPVDQLPIRLCCEVFVYETAALNTVQAQPLLDLQAMTATKLYQIPPSNSTSLTSQDLIERVKEVAKKRLQERIDRQAAAFRTAMEIDRMKMDESVRLLNEEAFVQVENEVRCRRCLSELSSYLGY